MQCANFRKQVKSRVFYPCVKFVGLQTWSDFCKHWSYPWERKLLCKPYYAVAEQLHENRRLKLWDRLLNIFGLPELNELRKER